MKSSLQKLHAEADKVLADKAKEIMEMTKLVDEAEEKLMALKAEYQVTTSKLQQHEEEEEIDTERMDQEIQDLKDQQEQELQEVEAKHQAYLQSLTETFQSSVKEAEKWAEMRTEAVKVQKLADLEAMKEEYEQFKASTADEIFASTQDRIKLYQEAKNASIMNNQRISLLESQISEITSITREEERDIKAKINECLASIDLRKREHEALVTKAQNELSDRKEKYEMHIKQLEQQHESEKKRLQQAIQSETEKIDNLQKVIRKMEQQHTRNLQDSLREIERMKTTLYQSRKEDEGLEETRSTVTQLQDLQKRQRQTEQEIAIVDQEIAELGEENARLRQELAKLDREVYRQ